MKKISLNKENLSQLSLNQMDGILGGVANEEALLNADLNSEFGLDFDSEFERKKSGRDTDCRYSRRHLTQCGDGDKYSKSGNCCEVG